MKLINEKETYDFTYDEGKEEKNPTFTVKKLSFGDMQSILNQNSVIDSNSNLVYLGGTAAKLKIKYSLVGWKNITDSSDKDVPCNFDNAEKLPPDVVGWLVRKIDELNRLTGVQEQERKKD